MPFRTPPSPRNPTWSFRVTPDLSKPADIVLPPRLYAKAHSTDIIDGTGFKPRNVDPAMNTAEMLIHLQRRANTRPAAA